MWNLKKLVHGLIYDLYVSMNILYVILSLILGQCKLFKTGVMCSLRGDFVNIGAH